MKHLFTRFLLIAAWLFLLVPAGQAQNKKLTSGQIARVSVATKTDGDLSPSTCTACYESTNSRTANKGLAPAASLKEGSVSSLASGSAAYVRSTNVPWGTTGDNTNQAAMNEVFGASGWDGMFIESTTAAAVFTPTRQSVFMDGSYLGANMLNSFLNANRAAIEQWVAAGGHLFLNAAPNQGSNINFGFGGVTLNYGNSFSSSGTVVAGHSIAAGPFLPAGNSYDGNYFSHATVSGAGLTTVITGTAGIVLGYKSWGSGYVFLGGITTDNFHTPSPNAHNLRKNILAFSPPTCTTPVVTVPNTIVASNTAGLCSASVSFQATATGSAPVAIAYAIGNSSITSPYAFPVGTTTVTATATNACGSDVKTFAVQVSDTELPVLTLPAAITVSAPATQCGAAVTFSPSATDNCAGATVVASPASGSTFPVGISTVNVTATDAAGNTSTDSFTVTVNDVTAPAVATRAVTVTLVNGAASVMATQVNNGSSDACGIASYNLDRTTFTCANLGDNPVMLTVTDMHGNAASAPAVVTVVGSIPAPAIAVTPSSSVYTGGVATNLYLGYGAQSATLTATGGTNYSWSSATNLSSSKVANPVFTATTAGTFTYTVTATNQFGCTATATVTLNVIDARCDKDKVVVCHNGHNICISPNAVNTHLTGHSGDKLGSCSNVVTTNPTTKDRPASASVLADALLLEAFPNPFGASTTVHFRPAVSATAQVRVYDALGRVVATLFNGTAEAGHDYSLMLSAGQLANGLYLCRYESQGLVQTQHLSVVK